MADIKVVDPKLPELTKEQKDGLAAWAKATDKPLEDESGNAWWAAGLASKAAYNVTAPVVGGVASRLPGSMPAIVGAR